MIGKAWNVLDFNNFQANKFYRYNLQKFKAKNLGYNFQGKWKEKTKKEKKEESKVKQIVEKT